MSKIHLTPAELEADCKKNWNVIERSQRDLFDTKMIPLLDFWDFETASDEMRVFVAYKLILECSPRVGSYFDNGDMHGFINKFAHNVAWSRGNFDDRRSNALRSALLLVAHKNRFPGRSSSDIDILLKGGAAPAAAYLLAMIEYFLRARSRYMNSEGELTRIIPNQLQQRVRLQRNKIGFRVNQIKNAFHLYLYRNVKKPASYLRDLQSRIKIDERLNLIRNPTMHGSLADPAAEAPFYALVVALFYYSENKYLS